MEKIIAILTQKGALSRGLQKNTIINLFKIKNEKVIEVENINLENTSESYFSRLMSLKQVSLIYMDSINFNLKNILSKIDIIAKSKEEMLDDKFMRQFIFD